MEYQFPYSYERCPRKISEAPSSILDTTCPLCGSALVCTGEIIGENERELYYLEHDAPEDHEHDYQWATYCGAQVCTDCRDHSGLARCFCGWAADGGDGYKQLVEMGEQIDDDY